VPGQPQLIFQPQTSTKNSLSSSIETESVDSRGFPDEEPHFSDEGYLSNKEGQQSEEGEWGVIESDSELSEADELGENGHEEPIFTCDDMGPTQGGGGTFISRTSGARG